MLLLFLDAAHCYAHAFTITETDITLHADGTITAEVPYHIDALLAGVGEGDPTEAQYELLRTMAPADFEALMSEASGYLRTSVRIKFDGESIEPEIHFPDAGASQPDGNPLPGERFVLTGTIPEGADEFTFTCSPVYKIVLMRLFEEQSDYRREEFINPGDISIPYSLTQPPPPQRAWEVILQYFHLGFLHIVPKGLDHILFVLGLFLLSSRLGPLLWQVTAFTIAHTTTLGLSSLGIIDLPASIVEPLIALSIAYVAVENCLTNELKPWRPAVVFGFGLLHGLGFAGVLSELGLPEDRFVSTLLSFNVGVEAGQLCVLVLAFALVGWARNREWYRAYVSIPASVLIGIVALYWTVTRIIA